MDHYGFSLPKDANRQELEHSRIQTLIKQREAFWREMESKSFLGPNWIISPNTNMFAPRCHTHPHYKVIQKLIRSQGIPPSFRRQAWMRLCETPSIILQVSNLDPNYYPHLLHLSAHRNIHASAIALDVHRTLPNHPYFEQEGFKALSNVLNAYSVWNPDVGYCQGMNLIAGLLLIITEFDEEDAFWLFVALLDNILPHNTYTPNMGSCAILINIFRNELNKALPELYHHLTMNLNYDLAILPTQWLVGLFIHSLPTETTLRIWDVLFNERSPRVLIAAAIAIFEINKEALLDVQNDDEAHEKLRSSALHLTDADALMQVVSKILTSNDSNESNNHNPKVNEKDIWKTIKSSSLCGMQKVKSLLQSNARGRLYPLK